METTEKASSQAEDTTYLIEHVTSSSDLKATIALIEEYTEWIGVDLSYQDYATELASMPGKYSSSAGGCLMLARHKMSSQPLGCIAMRSLPKSGKGALCEMKRLYVAPAGRGAGLGKALAIKAMDEARALGYAEMYLDTLPFMHAAIKLYEDLGFRKVDKYYDSAPPETVFFAKAL